MIKPVLFRSSYLYVFGLILLVSGLPVSFFITSLSQFVLAGAFFLEGNVVEKFKRYFKNKPALILTGILVMHVAGLLWTTDLTDGLKDIRIKLPLLTLTLIMGGSEPLSKKQFHLVLGFFIASVFAGTMISLAVLEGFIYRPITDIREIFIFHVSHIRFALFICIAVFSLLYFLFSGNYKFNVLLKILLGALVLWLLVFLVIMESVTGILITLVIFIFLLLYRVFKHGNILSRIAFFIIALLIPVALYFFIYRISDQNNAVKDVVINEQEKTPDGNQYSFWLNENQRENGYAVWVYVCPDELRKEWNSRSQYKYDSLDQRKQQVKYTLIRYLTSKGWRKNGEAVRKLSDEEVHWIEKGIANVNYQDMSSIRVRILQIAWEYDRYMHGDDPSGHSVMQRLEFWKAATGVIKEHPVLGVGTGDLPAAYQEQYVKMNTRLIQKFRLRAHNQFLAIAVAFGFTGLLYFLFALIAPMVYTRKYLDYFYVVFWITAMLSMLTEDTLETQTGATFFAFFSCLFLFRTEKNDGK